MRQKQVAIPRQSDYRSITGRMIYKKFNVLNKPEAFASKDEFSVSVIPDIIYCKY
jgi:hypothetical protein